MKRSTSGQASEKEIHRLKDFPAKQRMEGSFGVVRAKGLVILPPCGHGAERKKDGLYSFDRVIPLQMKRTN